MLRQTRDGENELCLLQASSGQQTLGDPCTA
jgi:hypothetical protein